MLLRKYGIVEKQTINCGANPELINKLRSKFGRIEFPMFEIDNKAIGNLIKLEEYLKNFFVKQIRPKNVEDEEEDDNESGDSIDENSQKFRFDKKEEKNLEKLYSNLIKTEEDNKREKEMEKMIDLKAKLIEKQKEKESSEVSGFVSYPLHLIETGIKSTFLGFRNYFWDTKNTKIEKIVSLKIPVLKTNWYGRIQKRFLKFHSDRIERLDCSDFVREIFLYQHISKITFTEKFFFHISTLNGTEELYHVDPGFLDHLLDLFESIKIINPQFTLQKSFENQIQSNQSDPSKPIQQIEN